MRQAGRVKRKFYPTDVSDGEWEFVAPHLTLLREDAAHRVCALRELFLTRCAG